MAKQSKSRSRNGIAALKARLREAEETLEAIRSGHVDALVVQGPAGEQVYTLKGADHRFRQLVETMNEGALLVARDGTIVYANARFAHIVGGHLEHMIGTPFRDYVAPPSRVVVEALIETHAPSATKAEAQLVAYDGSLVPVYLSATSGLDDETPLTTMVVTDLGDQKRQQELLEAEQLMSQIVDQAAEAIVVCDLAGTVVRASRAVERMTGRNPLLRSFADVFDLAGDGDVVAGTLMQTTLRGETTTGLEVALRRPDAAPLDLLISAGPIEAPDGSLLGCVISFVDITERKRAAEERQRLLEAATAARVEAEAANRAKDEFLAMLGHELRNPLAPILTALELMNLRGDPTSRREREVIQRQVDHVVRLIDDLLDVSRIAQGKIELQRHPVEIARLVDKAIEVAGPMINARKHRLALDVPADLWVSGDETRLCQVMSNLLTNAAKYTEPGGSIEVSARRDDAQIVIFVRDNGTGIPAALLENLFDMFVQGKRSIERSQGGLGLGLSIVRSLVALHGGTVAARSEGAGRGSEFEIRLDALPATHAEVAVSASAETPGPETGMRILVVDDNIDAADLLAMLLSTLGYEVRTAYDGPSGLAAADEFAPAVALLDIGLPIMDGYEVARRLRARHSPREMRLIALTGYGSPSDRQHSRAAGFDRHVVKPIDLTTLESTIRSVV